MKKVFALLLIACLLVPVSTPASIISPFYDMIFSIHGSCYIENGVLNMSGTVSAQGGKTTSAKVTITLQYDNGSGWKNGSSWSATGTNSATRMATTTAAHGTFYRLKITGTITYNGVSESDTIYTRVTAL